MQRHHSHPHHLRARLPNGMTGGGEMQEDRDGNKAYIEFYVYTASFGNIASGATTGPTNGPLQIQADSDFEWRKLTFFSELHGGTPPFLQSQIPELALMVTDGGSGRQLFSSATPLSSIAGNGTLPFILPVTYIFEAKSTIQLTLTNFSIAGSGGGASAYDNVFVSLIGNKIWKFGK
jgi:hypothetical protein